MKPLLIQLDDPTLEALDRVAPAAKRQRAAFIRRAIRDAVQARIDARTRAAYLAQPDTDTFADDWSGAEAWDE
jgi:predicted transcriptional regulator